LPAPGTRPRKETDVEWGYHGAIGVSTYRIEDHLAFGVPNIRVIDPWKHRGWSITAAGWTTATDQIMRTADGRVAMPFAEVLLP
jgi:hypothetical protein